MSETKFTPGPHYAVEYAGFWVLQRQPDYDVNDDLLNAEKDDRAGYNAKLYAAAPEMYDMLDLMTKSEKFREYYPGVSLLIEIIIKKIND